MIYLYRYKESFGYNDEIWIYLSTYTIIKETRCGYWINMHEYSGEKRWVSKTSMKRFAWPTKEEAFESFKRRKQKQAAICRSQLKRVENILKAIDGKTYNDIPIVTDILDWLDEYKDMDV